MGVGPSHPYGFLCFLFGKASFLKFLVFYTAEILENEVFATEYTSLDLVPLLQHVTEKQKNAAKKEKKCKKKM